MGGRPAVAPEARVRLVFLGAAGVGKTALIRRFLDGTFEPRHRRTVEELHVLELPLSGPPGAAPRLRLELLDTSGSYSFPAMRRLGISGGDAFALVFAPHQAGSFEEVRRLRDEILAAKPGAAPLLVVAANKLDLAEGGGDLAASLADTVRRDWGARYVEASAKQGRNVGALFRELLSPVEALSGRLSPALRRHPNPAPPARRACPRPTCAVA